MKGWVAYYNGMSEVDDEWLFTITRADRAVLELILLETMEADGRAHA